MGVLYTITKFILESNMKQYFIVCPSCQGTSRISNCGCTSNSSCTCPACGGSGKVLCTETEGDIRY